MFFGPQSRLVVAEVLSLVMRMSKLGWTFPLMKGSIGGFVQREKVQSSYFDGEISERIDALS